MEDYERRNALAWSMQPPAQQSEVDDWKPVKTSSRKQEKARQRESISPRKPVVQHNTHRPQPAHPALLDLPAHPAQSPRQRHPPRLASDSDDEAQQKWRNRERPQDYVNLPTDLVLQDQTHQSIARQHATFVFAESDRNNTPNTAFGIWGNMPDVKAAKQALLAWAKDYYQYISGNSRLRAKFPKISSPTPDQRKALENKWKKELQLQNYRRYPDPNVTFGAIGSFHWPIEECRPEEVLGSSHEALDPLRMDGRCHIIFVKEKNVFQVMGSIENVKQGLLRLRRTCFQIAARQIAPVRRYLLHWPHALALPARLPSHVSLEPYQRPPVDDIDERFPRASQRPRAQGSSESEDASRLARQTAINEERVHTSLLDTLKQLHYYRGNIQMRIRLGAFLALKYLKYKNPSIGVYELDEYERMIHMSQFEAAVTQEIGDTAIEHAVLHFLRTSTDLLQPEDNQVTDLFDVEPGYSAIFTFEDEAGPLCLTKCWQEVESTTTSTKNLEMTSEKWTRLERDGDTPTQLFDTNLSDLNTGMAWHFGIEASQFAEDARLPESLAKFAKDVQINAQAARKQLSDKLFINYKHYGGSLKHVQQRTSYRFNVRSVAGPPTDYTLELTRSQYFVPSTRDASTASNTPTPGLHEPRWSLNVFCTAWDTRFAENGKLKIGEMVEWDDASDAWFPRDFAWGSSDGEQETEGTGFRQLMARLKCIADVVRDVKDGDLIGGMHVE